MPASTVESGPPSSASNRSRIVWPAQASIDSTTRPPRAGERGRASRSVSQTTVWVRALLDDRAQVVGRRRVRGVREAASGTRAAGPCPTGSVIGAERIVVSPSRSLAPADEPGGQPGHERRPPGRGRRRLERHAAGRACPRVAAGETAGRGRGIGAVRVDGPAAADLEVVVERAAVHLPDRGAEDGQRAPGPLGQPQDGLLVAPGLGGDQRGPSGSPGSTSRTCTRRSGTCRTGSPATPRG